MKKFQKIYNSVTTVMKYALIVSVVVSTINHFKEQLVAKGLAEGEKEEEKK